MKKLLVCLAVSTVLLSGCSFLPDKTAIIKVNDKVITQAEFDKEFDKSVDNSVFKNFGGSKNIIKSHDDPLYSVFREKVVNELIIKSLIDSEIEKRNIKVSQEEIQDELKKVIDKTGSKEELNRILKSRGVSNNELIEGLKTQIRIKKLVNSIKKIEVSDDDVQKFYNSNPKEFIHPEQVRASHILISSNFIQILTGVKEKNPNISTEELNAKVEKQMAAQKAKAEIILAEVKKNPQNFEKIAAKNSDDKASAEKGGDLGFFSKNAMEPEFGNAAFSMKPDTISDLVKTQYGYHIIKVTDRMEAGKVPFVKVKDEIKFYLETQKQIEVLRDLTAGLMKTAKIEYLDENFNPAKKINSESEPQKVEETTKK